MSARNSIVWLASYPKSGNTWTRIFLANYLMNADRPVPINQVHRFAMGDSIPRMYNMVAGREIDVHDYTLTLQLRDRVLQGIVANKADINFVKTHNINSIAFGTKLIPRKYTRSAIYIIRNPLDMLISYARHYGLTHEATARSIGHPHNSNEADPTSVTTFLGGWSDHVRSWSSETAFPVLTVRYEDMLEKPEDSFASMLEHIGMPADPERLQKAIRFASFDEVSKQEAEAGFVETSPKTGRFFASGQSGQWQSELDPGIARRVKRDHRKTMKKYGYLDD